MHLAPCYDVPVADVSSWSFPACFLSYRVLYHLQACAARQAWYWCYPLFPLHSPQVEKRDPCLYGFACCNAPLVGVEVKIVFLLIVVSVSGLTRVLSGGFAGVAINRRSCVRHNSCLSGCCGLLVALLFLRVGLLSLELSIAAVITCADLYMFWCGAIESRAASSSFLPFPPSAFFLMTERQVRMQTWDIGVRTQSG